MKLEKSYAGHYHTADRKYRVYFRSGGWWIDELLNGKPHRIGSARTLEEAKEILTRLTMA